VYGNKSIESYENDFIQVTNVKQAENCLPHALAPQLFTTGPFRLIRA